MPEICTNVFFIIKTCNFLKRRQKRKNVFTFMISGTVGFRIAGLRFRIGLGLLWLGPGLLELKLEIGDTVRSGAPLLRLWRSLPPPARI